MSLALLAGILAFPYQRFHMNIAAPLRAFGEALVSHDDGLHHPANCALSAKADRPSQFLRCLALRELTELVESVPRHSAHLHLRGLIDKTALSIYQ